MVTIGLIGIIGVLLVAFVMKGDDTARLEWLIDNHASVRYGFIGDNWTVTYKVVNSNGVSLSGDGVEYSSARGAIDSAMVMK